MSEGLFRKAAIDKVSSPEQLDLLMRITSPVGWLALITVAAMIVAVGFWSVVGSIADLVDGQGVLFRGERFYDVKATMNGAIVAMNLKVGDVISTGQVVASLRQERAASEKGVADAVTIEKNRASAARSRGQLGTLQRQWQLQKQLVDQGIKAPKELLSLEQQMDAIRGEIESLEAEVRTVQLQAQATTDVKATESGRVVRVLKTTGEKIREDDVLVVIEPQGLTAQGQQCGGNIHAILYVSAALAGKVKKGQFARVSPENVKKEEFGFIFGKVESISAYAATTAEMTGTLKTDTYVTKFGGNGPVFEARVCLELDPANKVNAFKWSSSQGPPTSTEAGGICSASIVVDERKPYTYVIPAVRRSIGL